MVRIIVHHRRRGRSAYPQFTQWELQIQQPTPSIQKHTSGVEIIKEITRGAQS